MAKLTSQEAADKHARRLKAATTDIQTGVERVTTAPGQKAAKKADKMLQNITKAVQSGKWATRVGAVPLDEWKSKMINKGIGRIGVGIDEANAKMVSFFDQLLPAVDAAKAKIAGMPDMTIDDSINRMTTYVREMSKFSKK